MSDRILMQGNDAIARGLVEAGCAVAASYPGTPASEILSSIDRWRKKCGATMHVEWAVNEKVALEIAYTAAISGLRAAVSMKQVGLNVASDPLLSAAYLGVTGGFLVVSADDPGPHSSQTEQDSRLLAMMAKVPVLDPASPAQAMALAGTGFDLSEAFGVPVMLRPTTRVCHANQDVDAAPFRPPVREARFVKDPARWAATPVYRRTAARPSCRKDRGDRRVARDRPDPGEPGGFAGKGRGGFGRRVRARQGTVRRVGDFGPDRAVPGDPAVPAARRLHRPPPGNVRGDPRARGVGAGDRDAGRGPAPRARADDRRGSRDRGTAPRDRRAAPLPVRRASRPGRSASRAGRRSTADAVPGLRAPVELLRHPEGGPRRHLPERHRLLHLGINLGAVDTVLCMGAAVSQAAGFDYAHRLSGKQVDIVATIGDSTFYHSGIPPLIDAVVQGARFVLVILDNGTTAMTGNQPTPGTGIGAGGETTAAVDMEGLVRACGVRFCRTANPDRSRNSSRCSRMRSSMPASRASRL